MLPLLIRARRQSSDRYPATAEVNSVPLRGTTRTLDGRICLHRLIVYGVDSPVDNGQFNALFAAGWPGHPWTDFESELPYCLLHVCAYDGEHLIGFVKLAWDGGVHGFILEPVVRPDYRRRGVGTRLIGEAVAAADAHGLHWLHVDFEPGLLPFYQRCGFQPTDAGLIRLGQTQSSRPFDGM
ncbi:MAG: N-acetyltransferase [Chloroflexota bacterium]|nr:MAG: N-acetyltransferase [Chloroflexota bacterium]